MLSGAIHLFRRIARRASGSAAALAVALTLLVPNVAWAEITAGPSVRVDPNSRFDIRWKADFVGDGKVEIFDNPTGGTPVDAGSTGTSNTDHSERFYVGGVLRPDTTYYFKVTHTDPNGARADTTNLPPYPPVFTGAQAIGSIVVNAGLDNATIAWDANVIGYGRVTYGRTSPDDLGALEDQENTTAHSIQLTGLTQGTTYSFRVSNRHAIDGGTLADKTGSFTTQTFVPTAVLRQGHAAPRVIDRGEVSTLTVLVLQDNVPLAGARVKFEILPDSRGGATFIGGGPSVEAITDADGRAWAWVQGVAAGLVRIAASSPAAANRIVIPVVVRGP